MSGAVAALETEIEETAQTVVSTKIGEAQVNGDLHRFLGRDDIKLKDEEEEEGYSITRNGRKAKYLSEGEKTAIALIYFFTKIDEGKPVSKKIIVIDDPISSLDSQSTHFALSFIKNKIRDAKQVFLFTHNFYCLKEVKRWKGNKRLYKDSEFRSYMVECKMSGEPPQRCAEIAHLDPLLDKYESEYHY